eukprot:FR743325.1.p2 GENE.FR743325.1~~FR743325.1.p2  ORF type:complete len:114 (+),score=26.73 FR743325.1:620-961(+)
MSELTHINCVALTARFPVGKPVVPTALMNRPTPGKRRFCVLGALPLPPFMNRCARAFGCGERNNSLQRREIRFPQNQGKNPEKNCGQKAQQKARNPKKGRVGWASFSIGPPPP